LIRTPWRLAAGENSSLPARSSVTFSRGPSRTRAQPGNASCKLAECHQGRATAFGSTGHGFRPRSSRSSWGCSDGAGRRRLPWYSPGSPWPATPNGGQLDEGAAPIRDLWADSSRTPVEPPPGGVKNAGWPRYCFFTTHRVRHRDSWRSSMSSGQPATPFTLRMSTRARRSPRSTRALPSVSKPTGRTRACRDGRGCGAVPLSRRSASVR
jgi:hypothetical protein